MTAAAGGRLAVAQIAVDATMLGSGYTQNFDSMGSASAASLPDGWRFSAAGQGTAAGWSTPTNVTVTTQQASSGTPTTGGRYNWGSSTTDRAAGFMTSGSYISPNGLLFGLTNTTADTITGLTLAFDYERYRINSAAANVTLFASSDGATWTAVTAGDSGAFTTGSSSYTFTNGTVVNRLGITLSSVNIGQNQSYYLKWNFNTTGANSQGIGLDNVRVEFTSFPGDIAYYWVGDDATLGGPGTWSQTGGSSWRATNTDGTGQAWDSTKLATFGGPAAGTVTVSDTVTANAGLRFATTGYTLSAGTLLLGGTDAAANTIVTEAATVISIDSVLAGSNGLAKSGPGTLALGGMNSFTGGLTLGAGTLAVATTGALGSPSNGVTFTGGVLRATASLDLGGRPLSGNAILDVAPGTTLSGSGAMSLSGLALTTAGTARLSGNADFGNIDRTVTVASGGTLELGGNLTGSGIMEKMGAGRLVLSGDNTGLARIRLGTQGTTPVAGGTLVVSTPTALGATQVFFNNGTIEAAQPLTFANGLAIGGRSTGASRLAGAPMTFQGAVNTINAGGSGDFALVVDNDTTFSGTFSGAGTALAVTGSGTLRLTGPATGLTAPVSVSGGATLSVQGTTTFGSTALTVASGGSLAGDGTVGTLAVNSGGTLAPGLGLGTLRAGSTTFAAGGGYNFQISDAAGTAGTGWDLLNATGAITIAATSADPFAVNLWSLSGTNPVASGNAANFNNQTVYSWTFARGTSISGFAADKFTVSTASVNGTDGFANDLAGGSFSVAAAGTDLNVVFTPFAPGTALDWYGNGSTAGGSGSWTSLGTNWSPDSGATVGTWSPTRTAVFGGSGGTVTVQPAGIAAARGLDFRADGYTLAGGAVTLSGTSVAANAVTVGSAATTTVSAPLVGSAGMTKAGPGTLVLSGSSTYSGGTVVAAGTLQVGDGSSGSIAGDVAVATGGRLAFNPGSAGSFGGAISGSGEVVKEGSGGLALSGPSSHSGGTRLEGGSLTANGFSAFGTGGVTAIDGGLYAAAGASVSNTITVGEAPAAGQPSVLLAGWDFQTTSNGGTAVLAEPNTPNAYVANLGAGTFYLDGTNGSSLWSATELDGFGGTAVNAGPGFATSTASPASLALEGSRANGKSAVFAVDMTGYSLLDVSYATQGTANGFTSQAWAVSTDGITWQPVGTVSNVPTSFATRTLPTISALASGSTAYVRLTVDGATVTSGNNRLDNIQFLATPGSGPSGNVILGTEATSGVATFSGSMRLNQSVSLSAPAGGRAEFTGAISDAFGQNSLTKIGGGTVVLGGVNTYAGRTDVNEGTLLVTGSAGGVGVFATNGAIGGTGTVGPLVVNSGGQVTPGTAGPGTLTAAATTLASGGSYTFQIADAAGAVGTGWDLLDVNGGLSVTATQASPFTVNLWTVTAGDTSGQAIGFNPLQSYRWTFLNTDNPLSSLDLTAFTVNASATGPTGGFANATQGGSFSVAVSDLGTGLDVVFTPDAAASSLVWYGDDASPGGRGDWTALNVNWFNGSTVQAWDAAKTAVFDTVGGEVTIGPAGVAAGNGLSFQAADYIVSGGTLSLSGGSRLANSITVADGVSTTINAPLSGSAGMTKAGAGTLVLAADSSVSGGASVSAGTLQLGAGGTAGSLTGDVQLSGSTATLAIDRSDALTLAGQIAGTGALSKQGAGVLTLTGSNSYTGGTAVAVGTVVVGDGATAGSIAETGGVDLVAGTVLAFDRADTIAFAGRVTGPGTLEQRGAGTLTLSRASPYGPDFTLAVADGTVDLNRGGASLADILGAGNTATLSGGTLQLTSDGGSETRLSGALIDVEASSTLAIQRAGGSGPADHFTSGFAAPIAVANESTLTFDFRGQISGTFKGTTNYTSPVTLASNAVFAVTNSAGGTAEVIFSGTVGDGGAGHGLAKAGPQRLTLSGTNTYSGATAVAAGTLGLGAAGTIDTSPLVSVAAGATFDVSAKAGGYIVPTGQAIAGDGSVAGAITFATGGTVAPGGPVGTLTTSGDVTFGGGGNYNWQIVDAAGTAGAATGWDVLSVGGALSITASSAAPFAINLWSLSAVSPLTSGSAANFDATQAGSWRIASATGGITGFAADAFTVNVAAANGTAGFANAVGNGTFSVAQSGSDLNLVYTPGAPTNDIVIDVPTGSQTQAQAGYPLITTADSVTKIGAGTVVFDAVNTYTGPTTVSAGTLEVADADALATTGVTVEAGATLAAAQGTTIKAPSVTLDGGTLSAGTVAVNSATGIETLLVNAGTVSSTAALVVGSGGLVNLPVESRVRLGVASLAVSETAGGGLVDLGAGQVAVAAGGISAADLRADIIAGLNGGAWNGTAGITSAAAAAAGGTRAVGYVVDGSGARVSFAAPGDTNLDGFVDLLDLLEILGSGTYEAPVPAVWSQGDFNYDGVTDLLDLLAILGSGTYDQGSYFPVAATGGAGLAGNVAAVPEPGTLGIVAAAGLAALALARRRKTR